MRLILIRHGQTEYNLHTKTQGWCDSPLTSKGIEQAKNAGKILKDIPIHYIISSPSGRTIETLSYIVNLNELEYTTDVRLKEMNYGWFEARWDHLKNLYTILRMKQDYRLVGGESLEQALARFNGCINELYSKYPNSTILITTHGGVLTKFIVSHCLKQILKEYTTFTFCKNAAVNIIDFDGVNYKIICLNETEKVNI